MVRWVCSSQHWAPVGEDERLPMWEACHQLCRAMAVSETQAGLLLGKMMERAEGARQLAYRLYTLCERKGWAEEARAYNVLVTSWHGVLEVAQVSGGEAQGSLL
jgi:putative DNA methylase